MKGPIKRGKQQGSYVDSGNKVDTEALKAIHPKFKKTWDQSEHKINIKLIHVDDFPIEGLGAITNQILVMLEDGTYEVLPKGYTCRRACGYLGYRKSKVRFFSVLPSRSRGRGGEVDLFSEYDL